MFRDHRSLFIVLLGAGFLVLLAVVADPFIRPRSSVLHPAPETIDALASRLRDRGLPVHVVYAIVPGTAGEHDDAAGYLVQATDMAEVEDRSRGKVYCEREGHEGVSRGPDGDPVLRMAGFVFWGDPGLAGRI